MQSSVYAHSEWNIENICSGTWKRVQDVDRAFEIQRSYTTKKLKAQVINLDLKCDLIFLKSAAKIVL